jgi:hypothetical protein
MADRTIRCYLIVGMNGAVRAVKTIPRPTPTEVVVQVNLRLPTPPKIAAFIDIPDPPDANVDYTVAEWGPVVDDEA